VHRALHAVAGVRVHDVEAAEGVLGGVEDARRARRLRHVELQQLGAHRTTSGIGSARGDVGQAPAAARDEQQVVARAGEFHRGGGADPRARARDHRDRAWVAGRGGRRGRGAVGGVLAGGMLGSGHSRRQTIPIR